MVISFVLCFAVSVMAKALGWKAGAENPEFYEKVET